MISYGQLESKLHTMLYRLDCKCRPHAIHAIPWHIKLMHCTALHCTALQISNYEWLPVFAFSHACPTKNKSCINFYRFPPLPPIRFPSSRLTLSPLSFPPFLFTTIMSYLSHSADLMLIALGELSVII